MNSRSADIIPLEFLNEMRKGVVVADILVAKAGSKTIGEAAFACLPVLLTSSLPG